MFLRDFFSAGDIGLDLDAPTKDEALARCTALLRTDPRTEATILKVLHRREQVGSTGFGRGIAIPHCRSLVVPRLRVAYGRFPHGIEFDALDGEPVYHVFLIIAPPNEISNQYLPVLGKLAQFAKDPEVPRLLNGLRKPEEFLSLLAARGN
jgi:PTS system nitrogen regulatory IIA component